VSRETVREIGIIAWRSVRRTVRQPILIVPSVVFPLILMAVTSAGLNAATMLPGFPTDTYLDFALTVCFIQGAMFAAIAAGTELATDIETGFLDRLQLTPLRPVAVLVGQTAGAAVLALISTVLYICVGLVAGANMKAGVFGVPVLIVLSLVICLALAGVGTLMGARTGSAQAVQGIFPLLFVTMFLSSANLPRDLISVDWFREVATYNPISYLVEGLRSLIITGWDGAALAKGFAFAIGIGIVSFWAAGRALRSRMERT
jgi:ABC-2 type transport system permease protein